ncbi:thiolase domain-containing protein [Haloterrigena sp. H1]|uniref:thiolase domain-containing protein n=1 Tax=Haloterrigena sp. H1 TaxID=2552943 RepID=UPI00110F39B3|nr:thiolase domain-containing protein [Haloterrigena sp. H1]TMT81764.1 thiolase domain-containing protein [Haloterrigena sp. H1]TMT81818.1 thiolase domain-containing protein [Haloterrigena sp. H1]
MAEILIAGVGSTAFGNHTDRTGRKLFAEARSSALEKSAVPRSDVDALYYGNYMGETSEKQSHQAPLMASGIGTPGLEATRVENACASGGYAVADGVRAIMSGEADVVLVGGLERMTTLETAETTAALARAADELHEGRPGLTFPGAYALLADAYMERFGGTHEDLAHIAVKNHENAATNPNAQFHDRIDVEDVLEAPPVADPLGLLDACPISDGAAAAVLVSGEYAAEHNLKPAVAITGSGCGTESLSLQERGELTRTKAAESAAQAAYSQAEVTADDVDVAEVHDCFTIAEVLALEALGFYEPGEAITAARKGETVRDGQLPINLSGGLKAKGHPVGATGVSQLVELTKLLAGTHPNADAAPDAEVGVTHNAGGTVATAAVHVLEVAE